ncbi:MAG: ATP-binding protein [Flavobacteriaceae bacterium]
MRSELVVPLMLDKGAIGVINIESTEISAFGFEHQRLLELFARQAALVISLVRFQIRWGGALELASYGDMSANLAHRLNNIIGGVHQLAQIITKSNDAGEQVKIDASEIRDEAMRALNLIKSDREKFEQRRGVIDISVEIQRIIDDVPVTKTHRVKTKFPETSVFVFAHPILLKELLTELFTNAAKYTPEKGEISIIVERIHDNAVVKIRDSGQGIPSERDEYLFSRGMRGATAIPGSGYGLWWAKRFLTAIGGDISLKNIKPSGTEVIVIMPLIEQERHS